MYDTGIYALNVIDRYLDGEADREETYDLLDELIIPEKEGIHDFGISSTILSIRVELIGAHELLGTSTISDIKEERDELADLLNYDE